LASGAEKDIFSLLQKPSVKAAIADWNALFSFAYVFLRRSTSREVFDSKVDAVARDHRPDIAEQAPANTATILPFEVDSRLLESGRRDSPGPLRVFGIGFSEGTLLLLRHDSWFDPQTTGVKSHPPADSLMDPRDIKTSVCILSIRLNDSHRIADTMLPEVFFRLMNFVWHEVDDVATALGGKRIGNSGAHTHYVFKASAGRNPIYSAICCAIRINGRMSSLEAKITEDLGWVDEICVNMGISQGNVDRERSDSDGGMDLKIPGGPFDQASLLSVIADKGQIWITKNAVAQLPKPLISQVVVGVERKGQFRRNFFTRIEDMPAENLPDMPKPDLGALSIARILKAEQR
jgi:class 3 adenylate cyclase